MSKIVDITDKLTFDANPTLKIRNVEIEVNSDAETMLRIMGLFGSKGETEAAVEAANLIFGDKDRKKLEKMKLQFKDYMTAVQEAMSLAMGEEEAGE